MLTSQHDFRLVTFGEDRLPAKLYARAERVYLDSIGATARTKTSEIAYWKERYNAQFAKTGDRLFVYGFEFRGELIGFALVFYFKAHSLLVFDHIAIEDGARHLGAFFEFKNLIAQDLLQRNLQIDYVVAEIVTSQRGDPHPIDPQLLIQLLKQSGFKVAHLEYFTPSILEEEYDVRIETALLIRHNDRTSQISSPLLMSLVECILDDLYIRWYSPHSNDMKAFKRQIENLRSFYRAQLRETKTVELNGNWKEEHVPVRAASNRRRARGGWVAPQTSVIPSGLSETAIFIGLLLLTLVALAGVSRAFELSATTTIILFVTALFALLTILGVWHREAAAQARNVGRLLISLLRHNKDVR